MLPVRVALTPGASKTYGKLTKQEEWDMVSGRLDFYFVSSLVEGDQKRGSLKGRPEMPVVPSALLDLPRGPRA